MTVAQKPNFETWRALADDFRTMDWVAVRDNLKLAAGKLKCLKDIVGE